MRAFASFLLLVTAFPLQAQKAAPTVAGAPAIRLLIERFHLFPTHGGDGPFGGPVASHDRLFHMTGDPDALVTLGDLGGTDTMRLKAAVELNDVVLHAIAPDQKISQSDTHQRAAGDYRALDATGRPYQLRLGARLVW